jgi:hypothetical protein
MSLLDVLRCLFLGDCPRPWDPDADEDVRFLRDQAAAAAAEAARLRARRATGSILGDPLGNRYGREATDAFRLDHHGD